jgi:hypothetical protein
VTDDLHDRLAQLEARVLGPARTGPQFAPEHPAGTGCHYCGLATARCRLEDGTVWFPHAPNASADTCLDCHRDAHEFGNDDTAWRSAREHRDVVATHLVYPDRRGWSPGLADVVQLAWYCEVPGADPHPTDRFAYLDVAALRARAEPTRLTGPTLAELATARSPGLPYRPRQFGAQAVADARADDPLGVRGAG